MLKSVHSSARLITRAIVVVTSILLMWTGARSPAAEKGGNLRPKPGPARKAPSATAPDTSTRSNTVASLTASALESVVVITQFGRDGKEEGVGAGFIVSEDGLVATSLHVIGDARPIRVQLNDGRRCEVTEVFASDRKLDLALIRIDAPKLRPLPLGNSDALPQGATVVAIGNPLGLRHSVVQGVLSARRSFDGIEMLQLAIPIEPGNSGGPLIDMKGRVHGVLTLKSAFTPNLGFAMPVNFLKALIEKPNPVPMSRWLVLGTVNPRDWTPLFGARWSQRSGRVTVDGAGSGFGGRSLCLWRSPVTAPSFDLSVEVKLDDESGAAGLVFGSDGAERHHAFYPSAGQLRLTRFDGPNVFSWNILQQVAAPRYRAGDWNEIRVQVRSNHVQCYVNGELVSQAANETFAGEAVGLAKFRDTRAEFRRFQVSTNGGLSPATRTTLPPDLARRLDRAEGQGDIDPALASELGRHSEAAREVLEQRVRALEQQALSLRRLSGQVHRQGVQAELVRVLHQDEPTIDLAHAALLVSKHDNPDLDVESYRQTLSEMAADLSAALPDGASQVARLQALRNYLFTENGFHGSRTDYYNRANSYLNQVLDDREGLPITLSILFLELAGRIGLQGVEGLPLPGHFMVKFAPAKGDAEWIDVFDGGKTVSRSEAQERVLEATGEGFQEEHLKPAKKREIIVRMVRNLQSIAERSGESGSALHYLDLILALNPESAGDRLSRVRFLLQRGDKARAQEDVKWLLENNPPGVDLDRLSELYRSLGERESQ